MRSRLALYQILSRECLFSCCARVRTRSASSIVYMFPASYLFSFFGALVKALSTFRVVQRLGRGRRCHKFVPVLEGDGTRIVSAEDILDRSPGQMS